MALFKYISSIIHKNKTANKNAIWFQLFNCLNVAIFIYNEFKYFVIILYVSFASKPFCGQALKKVTRKSSLSWFVNWIGSSNGFLVVKVAKHSWNQYKNLKKNSLLRFWLKWLLCLVNSNRVRIFRTKNQSTISTSE